MGITQARQAFQKRSEYFQSTASISKAQWAFPKRGKHFQKSKTGHAETASNVKHPEILAGARRATQVDW